MDAKIDPQGVNIASDFTAMLDEDLSERPDKARFELRRAGAALSGKRTDQIDFVRDLLESVPAQPLILTDKPGFRNSGFVLGARIVGEAITSYHWKDSVVPTPIGQQEGTKSGWDHGVGAIAESSSFLTLAILIALAACLPGYYRNRGVPAPLSETAVFNFSGPSASGRTTISRACAGIFGIPDAIFKWDFTRRELEELSESRNDLVLILDDTEKHTEEEMSLKNALRLVNQIIPSGSSKAVSLVAKKKDRPDICWSTFGVTSSPIPLEELARNVGWKRSAGESVRLIDIPVESRENGGIFDRLTGSSLQRQAKAAQLIGELEGHIAANFGHVFPTWISFLLEADRTSEIDMRVRKFLANVAPDDDGWTTRFARKFGLLYAAGAVAVRAGILPWDKDWPARAASRCYKKALKQIHGDNDRAKAKLRLLEGAVTDPGRFPKAPAPGVKWVRLEKDALGVRTKLKGNNVYAIREGALHRFAGSPAVAKCMVKNLAREGGIIGSQGHAGMMQLKIPIRENGRKIRKPRFWLVDPEALRRTVKAVT